MSPASDPRERFSTRVEDYVRARPGYPDEVLALLRAQCGLGPRSVVADVGAGTGIFTRSLLESGAEVHALEPNAAMRAALAACLGAFPRLHVLDAAAEDTRLPAGSVDLITAAQAFHWFRPAPTRAEFARILRPAGQVALLWNTRRIEAGAFTAAYEQLLERWAIDYAQVDHRRVVREELGSFFDSAGPRRAQFPSHQSLDLEGVRRRMTSSSFAPPPEHPGHAPLMRELDEAFERWAQEGRVRLDYVTEIYMGRPRPA